MEKRLCHIGVSADEVGRYVLIPGSVERAALISEYFDDPHEVAHRGGYLTFSGTLEGVPVTVTSTGIGGPAMALAVEELSECGADTFIRVGSCASSSLVSKIGDVIIPRGAVRMEGTGDYFLPREFPAVPNYQLFRYLEQAASQSGFPYNTGVTITKDSFYTEAAPETKPVHDELAFRWDSYERAGATSTSMECAPLFLLGSAKGLRCASTMICATNYQTYSNDKQDYPAAWERRAIKVAIEGLRMLIHVDCSKALGRSHR